MRQAGYYSELLRDARSIKHKIFYIYSSVRLYQKTVTQPAAEMSCLKKCQSTEEFQTKEIVSVDVRFVKIVSLKDIRHRYASLNDGETF